MIPEGKKEEEEGTSGGKGISKKILTRTIAWPGRGGEALGRKKK